MIMESPSVSVQDFQDYHQQCDQIDAKDIPHSSRVASDDQLHDLAEDYAFLSDSAHGHGSSADDEAVFDHPVSRHSSPETSQDSCDEDISVLESVSGHSTSGHVSDTPQTPSKTHSPFHHPSSVRAMQLDTTPPHLATPSSQRKRFHTPSRQLSTPRSNRSLRRSTPSKLMNSSPVKTVKKEHPLVLLHVTLLPMPHNYSLDLLEAALPPATFANWKKLHEIITPTILQRGILIPHPREDYDVLEERVLESLGLKESRILKCGHFHLSSEEEADFEESEDEEDGDMDDVDICDDCGRRIRDGRFGDAGNGSKRWDMKVFAANGLMRAGAWSAAWREMERIDIDLIPWIEESMKRELELRHEEEEKSRIERDVVKKEEGIAGLDDERLREIYGHDASIRGTPAKERTQEDVDGLTNGTPFEHHHGPGLPRSPSQSPFKFESFQQRGDEIPLWELLRNYLYLAVQDPRNIAIWVLSIIVIFFAVRSSGPAQSLSIPLESSSLTTSTAALATTPTVTQEAIATTPTFTQEAISTSMTGDSFIGVLNEIVSESEPVELDGT